MAMSDAAKIAADVNAGRLHPVDVVRDCLTRIEARNAELNAVVRHDPEAALRDARAVANRIAAGLGATAFLDFGVVTRRHRSCERDSAMRSEARSCAKRVIGAACRAVMRWWR